MVLDKKIAMVIATNGYRDEEYDVPKEHFLKNGAKVTTVNSNGTTSKSMFGKTAEVDGSIHDINPDDYDAIVFVGGTGAAEYFTNTKATDLAKKFNEQGKIVAAICIAPSILANAHILMGKKATAYPSERENINAEGTYTGSPVEIDGNIITASGPDAAFQFAEAIVRALS